MNTYLVAGAIKGSPLERIEAATPEQAVCVYCRELAPTRVVVIHGDSATVYAVNEIKSLAVVRLGGY